MPYLKLSTAHILLFIVSKKVEISISISNVLFMGTTIYTK
jgi:hypothetical protein